MYYKIDPILLATCTVDKGLIYHRGEPGVPYTMAYGAMLLQDENEEYILVDTGIPTVQEYEANGYTMGPLPPSVLS